MRAAAGAEVEGDGDDDDGAERFAVAQHEEVRRGERYFFILLSLLFLCCIYTIF